MALAESRGNYSNSLLGKSLPFWQSGVEEIILAEKELYDVLWQNPDQYPELIAVVPAPAPTSTPTLTPTLTPLPAAIELPATAPSETATETPSPTIAATQTANSTPTADITATFLAGCTPGLEVVDAHTYSNNTNLWAPTNGSFDLYWTLRNSGTCPWPADLRWKFIEGEEFGYTGDAIPLESEISPGELLELETQRVFKAPTAAGLYSSTWQLVDAGGNSFGPEHSFVINVRNPATATPTPRPTSAIVLPPTQPSGSGGGSSSGSNNDPPVVEPPVSKPPTPSP
jgi:hypothetical protein